MSLASVLGERSTCLRNKVGCVIVDASGFILSSGYNGAPAHMAHCDEVGCEMDDSHCVRALHAEVNAIITAGRNHVSVAGATVYTTSRPCLRCCMVLIQAGIKEVVYHSEYGTDERWKALNVLEEAGLVIRQYASEADVLR